MQPSHEEERLVIQTQIIGFEAIGVVLIYESPRQYTKCAINRNTNTEYARTDRLYTHIRTCLEVFETLECYLELKGVEKRRRVIQDCNVCDLYFSHTAMLYHCSRLYVWREIPRKLFFIVLRMLRCHCVTST